jgi:hypothetical protein
MMVTVSSFFAKDKAEIIECKDTQLSRPSVTKAGLQLGALHFSYKDSAGMDYWTPINLSGSGINVRIFYSRERSRKRRNRFETLSLSLNSIGHFSYNTGIQKIRLSAGQHFTDFGLEYDLIFFLLRDVLFKNLDLGIGPDFRLEYMSFNRSYAPDIATRLHEEHAAVSLIIAARFSPTRRFRIDAGLFSGYIAGLSRLTHSVSGVMPFHFSQGWQICFGFSGRIIINSSIELSLDFQNQLRTLGSNYQYNKSGLSLSLAYALGKSK